MDIDKKITEQEARKAMVLVDMGLTINPDTMPEIIADRMKRVNRKLPDTAWGMSKNRLFLFDYVDEVWDEEEEAWNEANDLADRNIYRVAEMVVLESEDGPKTAMVYHGLMTDRDAYAKGPSPSFK